MVIYLFIRIREFVWFSFAERRVIIYDAGSGEGRKEFNSRHGYDNSMRGICAKADVFRDE